LKLGDDVDVLATPAGGASKSVFKVIVGSETYAVRLKTSTAPSSDVAAATQAVADLKLTPAFVSADDSAVIQRWNELTAMPAEWAHDVEWCRKVGLLCKQLHSISIDTFVTERGKARPQDIAELIAGLRPKLAPGAGKVLDMALEVSATVDVTPSATRGVLVWTHGDLHYDNLLINVSASGALNVIDFELVGPRPRETDLAYLMFMSGLKNPAMAPREDGRRALAAAYLGVDDVAAIDALLLSIERETPLQAIWVRAAATVVSVVRCDRCLAVERHASGA